MNRLASSSWSSLSRLSSAQSRSISPENRTEAPGGGGRAEEGTGAQCARDLGIGWKISPSVIVPAGTVFTLADIEGEGVIQQIWMTLTGNWRFLILRFYWDHEETPAIECPAGDFFCCGWGKYAQLSSLPVCVNPGSAFNCYWEMPFHSHARITLENCSEEDIVAYYQINCSLGDVPADGISRFRTISRPLHTGIRIDPLTHRIRFRRKICLKSFDSKA